MKGKTTRARYSLQQRNTRAKLENYGKDSAKLCNASNADDLDRNLRIVKRELQKESTYPLWMRGEL